MRANLYRSLSILILGILLGSVATNMYIGLQLDQLFFENSNLRDKLADADSKLEKLNESSNNKKKLTITELEVSLIMDSAKGLTDHDQLVLEAEVNKKVKYWLQPLIGQEVVGLDSHLISRIVDRREIEVNGNKYSLMTYLIVVNQKTTVYLKSTRIKSEGVIN